MATNGSFSQQDQLKGTAEQYLATSGPTDSAAGGASAIVLSNDVVGWYFVEQYYTTLSKSPEKLHLFYGKKSQFVSGLEAELVNVSVGRSAIQERIKELDFQDCKVRITNVDSQASFDSILIQVIGETSNNSAELKKFVQTFVLAKQATGYFVLNDVFRYINDELEVEQAEGGTQEESGPTTHLVEDVEMPKNAPIEEPAAALDIDVVNKKLEDVIETEPVADIPSTNGTSSNADEVVAEDPQAEEAAPAPEVAEKEVEEEIKETEKPADPVPTPAPVAKAAVQPSAPPKPLSWASRAAAAVGSAPKPVVPILPKTSTPPAQSRAAPPAVQASKPAPAPTPAAAPAVEKNKENTAPGAEWQTAGSDHSKRQNRPQSISGPPEEKGTMGYVRNVTEKVDADELKAALASHGQLVYFDVNRGKNCAFVEFATPEGYQAAAAANPHQVSGEPIYVEARRPKAGAYGSNNYAGGRGGGLNGRGRGGFEQNRAGGQGQGGRGNFGANRGRGGAPGAPARGGRLNQTTNA